MNILTTEISVATKQNWQRLGTADFSSKLKNRANKRFSEKKFIPEEYIKYSQIINLSYKYQDLGYSIEEILFSVILNLTKNVKNKFLKQELESWGISENRVIYELMTNKFDDNGDILGGIYQSLLTEGEKNKKGSYYTPDFVVKKQIDDFFQDGQIFLDPCCGTGQYLLHIQSSNPKNIWGADNDKLAVKIARINLMIKYKNTDFEPNIFYTDSILNNSLFENSILKEGFFDIIATNPPWGAKLDKNYFGYSIKSGESFSYFLEKGLKLLKKGGILSYILPESILNVKVHEDIRKLLLDYNILSIYELGRIFTGVFTEVIRLDIKNEKEDGKIEIFSDEKYFIEKALFKNNSDFIFSIHINEKDNEIINKVYSKPHLFLNNSNSDWALGIVTGNNEKFLKDKNENGCIPVYTGKEVDFYKLKTPKKYLLYSPENYQQMASIEKYQAKPKLIYKFISNKPVFSFDEKGVFTLNSANILIPKIDYSIKVILALFNSELYKQIFQKKFNSIKVLKSHIQELPLPILDEDKYRFIENKVDEITEGKATKEELDNYIFNLLTT